MRILIISDLHLTHKNYNDKKLSYLINLINKYDQVIVNGDLWCAFTSTFDQFLNSKWADLFDVLLEHKCVYIEGNHDLLEYSDSRLNKFCTKSCRSYNVAVKNTNIFITHGHGLTNNWYKNRLEMLLKRLINTEVIPIFFEEMVIRLLGIKTFLRTYGALRNRMQKDTIIKHDRDNYLRIVGHTHCLEDSRDTNYINLGRIGKWYSSYISIIDNEIKLNFEYY